MTLYLPAISGSLRATPARRCCYRSYSTLFAFRQLPGLNRGSPNLFAAPSSSSDFRQESTVFTPRIDVSTFRPFSTSATLADSLWRRMKKRAGLSYRYPKRKMRFAALKLYFCCCELVNYDELFDYLELPDTFFSYFLLLQLHVWLVLSRIAQDGDEGAFVKKELVNNMWADIDEKSKKLAPELVANRKQNFTELMTHFSAMLFSYDEGILGDDTVLAGALWRTLFSKNLSDPIKLTKIVLYVRKQASHLDHQRSDTMLNHGIVTFLPFEGDSLNYDASLKDVEKVLLGFSQKMNFS